MVNTEIRLIIFFADKNGEALYSQQKQLGADCGSDPELLMAKFRLKLKKGGKTTRLFSSVQFSSVAQSCPTLCDPIDGSPPGSSVPGILQGKNTGVGCHFLLQCVKVKSLSRVQLLVTPWTSVISRQTIQYHSNPSLCPNQ